MNWRSCPAIAVCLLVLLVWRSPTCAEETIFADRGGSTPAWLKAEVTKRWTGDLDGMIKRRVIRVLVVYSQTYYFIDKGTQRGLTYDGMRLFEDEFNRRLKTKNLQIHIVFIPVRRDELIPALLDGRGDIAAAGLTITPERNKLVDFSDPIVASVSELVITGPASPELATLDDLSGKEVFVRKSSSYYEHLQNLNARLARAGRAPVTLKLAPESLEDEDLLEMLNAGLIQFVIVDSPIAQFWKQILPKITVHSDLAVNTGGEIAWMFRENSRQLRQEISAFIKRHPKSDAARGEILRKYLKSTKFVKDATSETELKKFEVTVALFQKYGDQYTFDYLLMMAQGYQESRLDQNVHSRVGAIGVMQVMPQTGASMRVGDVSKLDPNIHAGVKFIASMRDKYFVAAPMDELNKTLFCFAAYNAGPTRILRLRSLAAENGLDPNLWFDNVELVVAEKVGRETITYVRNIYKYYIAYRLVVAAQEDRRNALKMAKPQ